MNTFNKHHMDLELSRLEMMFSHIRIAAPQQFSKLTASIDACGQLSPVIVVPSATLNHYTLMDGYLRIQVMKKLRQDVVKAEIWECTEAEALLSLLANHGQRNWEAFEEAQALHELETRYQLSQEQIARQIGRTQSWVSRRLALLRVLPDKLIHAVTEGKISVWTAHRVLVPMARAIPPHADQLFSYLQHHSHSTRELSIFFKHYQKTNHASREKMVMQPDLFFKAQKALQADRQAKLLKAGPEGRWRSILAHVGDQIHHLEKLVPELFYERQDEKTIKQLLLPLMRLQNDLHRISITSKEKQHDRQNDAPGHYHAPSIGQELSAH
jgi:ParB family chromosome partitioning protein